MRLTVFNNISLDGYFVDSRGDMRWAHTYDPEWAKFSADNARGSDGMLLFGRKTYEMMAAFWPTDAARTQMPEVAEGMNRRRKLVVSRSLTEVSWSNASLLNGDLVDEVRTLKQADGAGIVILGSGTVVAQLSQHRLIDEYTFVIVPVALGGGRTLFEGLTDRLALRRTSERAFQNGNVVATYAPA